MENNKRVVLTLALVTVIAVAAIGIGYAYTASTSNSGNTVLPGYMETTLKDSTNNSSPAYTDVFDGTVKYNTEVRYADPKEYIKFKFDDTQLNVDTDGDNESDAVKVGDGVYLNIAYVNGVNESFNVIMTDNQHNGMSAIYSYKIGYRFGTDVSSASSCVEQFVPFEPGSGAILNNSGNPFTGGDTSGIKVILINLYVQGMAGELEVEKTDDPNLIKPLDNVTFKFLAASQTSLSNLKYTVSCTAAENGTVSASTTSGVAPGTESTITVSPNTGYKVGTFTVNGIDYKSKIADNGGSITIKVCDDIVVEATFVSSN